MTRNELYTNFSNNIEIERTRLALTQQKMADLLGISLSKYKTIITNPVESNIDIFLAHKVQKITGKTARELCQDPMPDLEMVKLYRELPKHRQDAIRYIIETEHELMSDSGKCSNSEDDSDSQCHYSDCSTPCDPADLLTIFVPTGNLEDGMILDSRSFETINISEYRKHCHERIDCGIRITSNHLHPAYLKDDVLLITKRPPRDGDIGIFIRKDSRRIFIREFKQTSPCELRPINGYGEIIYVDSHDSKDMDNWIKFGTVLTTMR